MDVVEVFVGVFVGVFVVEGVVVFVAEVVVGWVVDFVEGSVEDVGVVVEKSEIIRRDGDDANGGDWERIEGPEWMKGVVVGN